MMLRRRIVKLVQGGVWDMPKESLPLASAYLNAVLKADDVLRTELDVEICNFRGGASIIDMARALFFKQVPDVMAFSVFGWNWPSFSALAETFRQLNPEGIIVLGGTHVAHQANRVFGANSAIDIIVNGEGEFVFRDLMRLYLAKTRREDFLTDLHQ